MRPAIPTIVWEDGRVIMLDQRKLPQEETFLSLKNCREVIWAIREMVIRGAPAIGIAAAMGLALGAREIGIEERPGFDQAFGEYCREMLAARPTAVNLSWAIRRMEKVLKDHPRQKPGFLKTLLLKEARRIHAEDLILNRRLGEIGQEILQNGDTVLTHCNAGGLATGGFGTALGVLVCAWKKGKKISVMADETRPFLQGARLTAWELKKEGIPVTVITDSMAGYFMKEGKVDLVLVGADRIAANGDTANKIGTYALAVLARAHKIPFFVAAPFSSIDLATLKGEDIPIENRPPEEVTHLQGQPITPPGVPVANPAFDVTPHRLITGIITEKGIATRPYRKNLLLLSR